MNPDLARRICLSLPHSTEEVLWENNLVFKIGGKMFAIAALEPSPVWISFKCSLDDFADLTERIGIIPAPYLARAQWVGLENETALTSAELEQQLQRAYNLVRTRLPKKIRATLS